MATSTQGTTLTIATKSYAIKDFPEILGQRSALETTTLSDDAQTFIPGIRQTAEDFPFLANYDADDYAEINALTGTENECKLTFGDGSGFSWKGGVNATINEGAVDAVMEMTIHVVPSTVPVWAKASA